MVPASRSPCLWSRHRGRLVYGPGVEVALFMVPASRSPCLWSRHRGRLVYGPGIEVGLFMVPASRSPCLWSRHRDRLVYDAGSEVNKNVPPLAGGLQGGVFFSTSSRYTHICDVGSIPPILFPPLHLHYLTCLRKRMLQIFYQIFRILASYR